VGASWLSKLLETFCAGLQLGPFSYGTRVKYIIYDINVSKIIYIVIHGTVTPLYKVCLPRQRVLFCPEYMDLML
jgi:hypothetical protein